MVRNETLPMIFSLLLLEGEQYLLITSELANQREAPFIRVVHTIPRYLR